MAALRPLPVGAEKLLLSGVGKESEGIENAYFIDVTSTEMTQKNVLP
jgi:hypothetical protein